MALDILFFHNRNSSLADETNQFTIILSKEVFASAVFSKYPAFITNFLLFSCHVLLKFTYNYISLVSNPPLYSLYMTAGNTEGHGLLI
jgi:hypothetical protein